MFGEPGTEHPEWLNAIERASGRRRQLICEQYWRGEISAEEARRLLGAENALIHDTDYLGVLVSTEADLIGATAITVASAAPVASLLKGLRIIPKSLDPWLGKVAIHGAHARGPHRYPHLQIMIRTGAHVTRHIRVRLWW